MYIKNKGKLSGLIISALILSANITANCQDSTRVADKDLQAGVAIIEEWRFMKLELKSKDENIAIMANQIDTKNKQIAAFKVREKKFTSLIDAYKQDSTLAASQINVYKGMTTGLKKDLKKQRTKTTLAIIGGIAASGLTLWLSNR